MQSDDQHSWDSVSITRVVWLHQPHNQSAIAESSMTDYVGHLLKEATEIQMHSNNFLTDICSTFPLRCSWYFIMNVLNWIPSKMLKVLDDEHN